MSLQSSLCTYIETKSAITDLIGTSPCRFVPQIPKGNIPLPFAVYSRSSVKRFAKSTGSTGLVATVIRITSFAREYVDAIDLANQFRIVLDGKQGDIGDEDIDSCNLIDESDSIDPVEFGQNDAPHFVSQDFQFMHRESLPTL